MGSKQLCYSHFGAKKVSYGLYFGKTCYNDLVFLRTEFLRLVGALNESLILIIIYYMFKYSVGIKTTLLESLRSEKKKPIKGFISAKLVIRTLVWREVTI